MLTLYEEEERRLLSFTAISLLVRVPMTTLLRWITFLELKMLVRTESVPTDARVKLLKITDHGRDAMDGYLTDLLGL